MHFIATDVAATWAHHKWIRDRLDVMLDNDNDTQTYAHVQKELGKVVQQEESMGRGRCSLQHIIAVEDTGDHNEGFKTDSLNDEFHRDCVNNVVRKVLVDLSRIGSFSTGDSHATRKASWRIARRRVPVRTSFANVAARVSAMDLFAHHHYFARTFNNNRLRYPASMYRRASWTYPVKIMICWAIHGAVEFKMATRLTR